MRNRSKSPSKKFSVLPESSIQKGGEEEILVAEKISIKEEPRLHWDDALSSGHCIIQTGENLQGVGRKPTCFIQGSFFHACYDAL